MVFSAADSVLRGAVLASGLVTEQQLDYCLRVGRHRQSQQGIAAEVDVPDDLLSEILVEQNHLTEYQANQLCEGKTKLNLGPYVVTDWIGQGGMGQVYKAVHRVMGRECAVKVLRNATSDSIKSFAHEIRMQAKLDCPYLVRAFDAGQDGRVHYLVTEYVPGRDLRGVVKSQGPLPMQQAAQIVMQAALGLEYAHDEGMVHRDVKPANILVTPDGLAKVSDVGLAGFASDLVNDPRAGKIVGTTDYLSPEQIRTPLDIKPATDIYSLGCTLYYAVCGKVPFPGGDTESKLRRHLYEFPLHPRQFVPEISEDFADLIVDMMEKDVRKRIANAGEVAARLEPWASESSQIGSVTLSRSPWSPPPPPQHYGAAVQESPKAIIGDASPSVDSGQGEAAETLGDQTLGDQTLGDQTLGDQTLGDQTLGDQTLGDQTLGDQEQSVASHVDVDTTRSDAMDNTLPGDALPEWAQTTGSGVDVDGAKDKGAAQVAGAPALPSFDAGTDAFAEPSGASGRVSTGMSIALTIAIVVPPSLLIGAIIGYLAHG